MNRRIIIITAIFLSLLSWATSGLAQKTGKDDYFFVLDTRQGLSDNNILQMLQLPDNRLAVRTQRGVNIYDGKRFLFVPLSAAQAQALTGYDGQTHMYADSQDRLWIKEYHLVFCINLQTNTPVLHPLDSLAGNRQGDSIHDLYVDSRRNVWIVKRNVVINVANGHRVTLRQEWGRLQDLDIDGNDLYTFHATGMVASFRDGGLVYTARAYSPAEARKFQATSLVVKTPGGQFYQIRTGRDDRKQRAVSVFLHFDPASRKYVKLFECDYVLHTLNMSSDRQALISSQHGYLMFDFRTGNTPQEVSKLSLPDGKSLVSGINTVYRDRDGAIWLGTYHDGLIYVSPMLGLFFTMDKPWWQSARGIMAVAVVILTVLGGGAYFLRKRRARHEEPTPREELAPAVKEAEPEFIAKVRVLVEQHLAESEYGVEQLANDLCMERTGLYKKMKSLSGTTPVTFMRDVRLQRAAAMLKEDRMTVNEIAESTGFASSSYFAKCFKKAYGVLPSEYK